MLCTTTPRYFFSYKCCNSQKFPCDDRSSKNRIFARLFPAASRSAREQIQWSFRNGCKSCGHDEQSCIVAHTGHVLLENDSPARDCTRKKVSLSGKPLLNRSKDPIFAQADANPRQSDASLRAEILPVFFPAA